VFEMANRRKESEKPEFMTTYLKEKIMADFANTQSYSETSKRLNVPVQAVRKIVTQMRDDYNEIREEMKKQLIEKLWGNLIDAQELGNMYVKQALAGEREIPLNHVSNYFGTMYDKQALLAGDNTQNIGGDGIQVVMNMPDTVKDEEEWEKQAKSD
jgi:hypothetical protein